MERRGLNFVPGPRGHFERENGDVSFESFSMNLTKDGVDVGVMNFRHYTRPSNFYMPFYLDVKSDRRGEGIGKAVVLNINDFLSERDSIGILNDEIDKDSPASGMYERNGWKRLFDESETQYVDYMYYSSLPLDDGKLDELRAAIKSIP